MDKRGVRSKWFPCLVYEEQVQSFRSTLLSSPFEFALILHDRDIDEEGQPKKPHYHAVVVSEKREFHCTLARKLNIDERFMQAPFASEPNGAFRYLLHLDDPGKAQYKAEELETNISADRLTKYLLKAEKISDEEKSERVLTDIENLAACRIGYREFLKRNPAFLYQSHNLANLIALVQSGKW